MRVAGAFALMVVACGVTSDGKPPEGAVQADAAKPSGDAGVIDGGVTDAGTGDGDPPVPYKSGTRIKMQMLTTPDGAKIFQGNYDVMRNEACGFYPASDGAMRCLPSGAAFTIAYFADSSCTVPAVLHLCGPAPKYLMRLNSNTTTCTSTYHVYSVSPTPIGSTYYSGSAAACTQATTPAGYAVYAASGPEIPPSNFQSATLAVE